MAEAERPETGTNGSKRGNGRGGMSDLLQAGRNVGHELEELAAVVQREREALGRRVRERPLLSLGAAFAAGFVLGGGLASRFGAWLLSAGVKLAAAELARRATTMSSEGSEDDGLWEEP